MAPTNHPNQPHDTKQFFGEEKAHQQKATSDTPITDETILAKSHQIIQNDDALKTTKSPRASHYQTWAWCSNNGF